MEVAHLSILTAPFKTNLCMINNHFLSEKKCPRGCPEQALRPSRVTDTQRAMKSKGKTQFSEGLM